MSNDLDAAKILTLITEDEDPEVVERFARKLVEKYLPKAAMLMHKLSLDEEFRDNYITITSARELTADQKKLIERIVEKKAKTKLPITYLINEDLLGGIIIRRGETVIDNTLRSRVEQLTGYIKQMQLTAGASHGE